MGVAGKRCLPAGDDARSPREFAVGSQLTARLRTHRPARSSAEFDVRIAYAAEAVDIGAELARLKKETEGLEKAIASKERQLRDETFLSRAPEKIVNGLKMAVEQQRVELGKLVERRRELEGDR